MNPAHALLAALGLAIAGILFWKLVWPKLVVPNSIHIGPFIGGKSRSVGLPKFLKNGGFDFPQPSRDVGHVHAIVKPIKNIGNTISLRYRIEADDGVTFHPQENPSAPATISLMVQRKGDDYSAAGEKNFYRLYAPGPQELTPGEHTLVAELRTSDWVAIMGGEIEPSKWDDMINNIYAIHICFGSYGGRAHGVYASGPARFFLLSID